MGAYIACLLYVLVASREHFDITRTHVQFHVYALGDHALATEKHSTDLIVDICILISQLHVLPSFVHG